jgi:hypothetical protein
MKHKTLGLLKLYGAIFFSCTVALGSGFLFWQDAYTARMALDKKVTEMRADIALVKACSDLEEGTLIGFEVVSFEQDKVRIDQQEPMRLPNGSFANCAPFVMVTIDGSPPLAQPGAGCVLHLYREAEIFVARYPFPGQDLRCIAEIKMDDDGSHGVIAINSAAFSVKMVP